MTQGSPFIGQEQEQKHSCSGSWVLEGAVCQKTQKAMKTSIYLWEGGESESCSLVWFCKIKSLLGRAQEHSVLSIQLGYQWQCAQNAWLSKPSHPLHFRRHPPIPSPTNYPEKTMWVYTGISSICQIKSAQASAQAWIPWQGTKSRFGMQSSTPLPFLWQNWFSFRQSRWCVSLGFLNAKVSKSTTGRS